MHHNEFSLWAHLCSLIDTKKLSTPGNATYRNQNVSLAGHHSRLPVIDMTVHVFHLLLSFIRFLLLTVFVRFSHVPIHNKFIHFHWWIKLPLLTSPSRITLWLSVHSSQLVLLMTVPPWAFLLTIWYTCERVSVLVWFGLWGSVCQCDWLMLSSFCSGYCNLHPAPSSEPTILGLSLIHCTKADYNCIKTHVLLMTKDYFLMSVWINYLCKNSVWVFLSTFLLDFLSFFVLTGWNKFSLCSRSLSYTSIVDRDYCLAFCLLTLWAFSGEGLNFPTVSFSSFSS